MNRKLVIWMLMSLALLVACGEGDQRPDDGREVVEVTLWQGFKNEEVTIFNEIMGSFEEEWEKENPDKDLRLKLERVSYDDMITKLKTAALAHITPDIALVDSIKVTDLAFGQALVKIDELDSFRERYGSIEEARAEFVNASYNAGVVNRLGQENLYALPVQSTTVALFWNKDMFRAKARQLREAGLDPNRAPVTWDELLEYARVLTDEENGVYGYAMHNSLWFNFPTFNMYDVPFVKYNEDGTVEPAVDNENMRLALKRLASIATSGVEGGAWKRSALGPDTGFLNEKYAMITMGPWMVEKFDSAGLDFDIDLIPMLTKEEARRLGVEQQSSSNVGGQSGVILRESEHADLAFQILDHFTSEEAQRAWASSLGQIPVRLAAWEGLDTSKYPYVPKFMAQLRLSKRIPQIPLYSILEGDIFVPELNLLLGQAEAGVPVDPLIDDMIARMERAMNARIFDRMNDALESAKKLEGGV